MRAEGKYREDIDPRSSGNAENFEKTPFPLRLEHFPPASNQAEGKPNGALAVGEVPTTTNSGPLFPRVGHSSRVSRTQATTSGDAMAVAKALILRAPSANCDLSGPHPRLANGLPSSSRVEDVGASLPPRSSVSCRSNSSATPVNVALTESKVTTRSMM